LIIPNEFAQVGKYNLGITAGVETDIVSPEFIEGANKMNLNIVPSKFTQKTFLNTVYDKSEGSGDEKKKVGEHRLQKSVLVLSEGIDVDIYKPFDTTKIKSNFKDEMEELLKDESIVYLHVGLWGKGAYGEDRKNISLMIKTFYEAFANDPKEPTPALLIKTNGSNFSVLDRYSTVKRIKEIKKKFDGIDKLPNVYLLHGDLTIEQMAILYNLPKIKAFLTCTHGEGFGRPMLEASCCDLPVIASNWSGHLDFLNSSESLLIQGKLKKVPEAMVWKPIIESQAQWYDVGEVDVKRKLRLFYNNVKGITSKAKSLGKKNRKNFSLEKMAYDFNKMLDDIIKNIPQQVSLKLPKLKKVGSPKSNKLKLPKLKKQ
jgi:glycosyltransferase involved in cell wall biosynthesis